MPMPILIKIPKIILRIRRTDCISRLLFRQNAGRSGPNVRLLQTILAGDPLTRLILRLAIVPKLRL